MSRIGKKTLLTIIQLLQSLFSLSYMTELVCH